MPAYHSKIAARKSIQNIAFLTFNTKVRGPVQTFDVEDQTEDQMDIIDEGLAYFRANVFFKSFDIQSNSDRVLIYITLYISECLKKLTKISHKEAAHNELNTLAMSRFDIPGDIGFPLNTIYAKPSTSEEADLVRQYFLQLRHEIGLRLVDKIYDAETGKPSKWWLCFAKRKFMDITLSGPGN